MTDASLLDEDRLLELDRDLGEGDLALVLAMFLDEAAAEVAKLEAGLPDPQRRKAGHFLRSGALNLGLTGLSDAARAVEGADDRPAAVAAVRAAVEATRDALGPRAEARAA